MDALIVSDVDPFSNILGTENREIVSLFSLYHEFGHTQIPGPDVDKTHVMSEASADAYAAIRLLQRFGTSVVPFLSMISWVRCYRAIDGSPEHLTSPVLDKIIADAEIQDFSALSAGEAAVRADEYAKAWAPDEKVMERAIPDFQQQSAINMQQLFDTTLMSPDQFSFYVGAKFFQPFLCREGVLMKGKLIQHTERDIRNIARRIERRLQGKGLSWIYNRAAQEQEVPLAEAIKVLQPPGQKGLTVGRAPGPS